VTLLGVPGRDDEGPMRDFVARHGLAAMPQLVDGPDASIWTGFGIRSQPAWVFVSADGSSEVVLGPLGAEGLAERLDALVADG
jgi:hypothetical protein